MSIRIYLQAPGSPGDQPRFCHLVLEQDLLGGWVLLREWGRQGTPGRVRRDQYDDQDAAEAALNTARDELKSKGYQVVFTSGQTHP